MFPQTKKVRVPPPKESSLTVEKIQIQFNHNFGKHQTQTQSFIYSGDRIKKNENLSTELS